MIFHFLKSQLGTGDTKDQLESPVLSIKDKNIISVCCGDLHTVILLEDGQLLGFGYPENLGMKIDPFGIKLRHPSLLVKDNTIKTISCGIDFTLAQTMNGEVFHFKGEKEQQESIVNKNLVMKDASIKFLQQRNFIGEWTPETHPSFSKQFKEIVLNLLLCLKIQRIKVPKFVFFIIVRQI